MTDLLTNVLCRRAILNTLEVAIQEIVGDLTPFLPGIQTMIGPILAALGISIPGFNMRQ
jgi:hypothetical protein